MRARLTLVLRRAGWVVLAAVLCGFAYARPHVVDRWALYLGSESAPEHARLYLDPFPDAISCESRVRTFTANAESAYCAVHRELAFGYTIDALLAKDFARITLVGANCIPRRPAIRSASRRER